MKTLKDEKAEHEQSVIEDKNQFEANQKTSQDEKAAFLAEKA